MIAIRCQGTAGLVITGGVAPIGQWLKSYDPEAHDGLGTAVFTEDLGGARLFADAQAAYECYMTVPESLPTRPDGRPNRPLTAFHVELVPIRLDGSGHPVPA